MDKYLHINPDQKDSVALTRELVARFGSMTMDFLLGTTLYIHDQFTKTVRHEGPPHSPDQTLNMQKGSCRDLAVLLIEIFRNAGFAARFTSGYKIHHDEGMEHELHAWVEVYVPGAGWYGLDPSTGLTAGNDHIAVSSGIHSFHTMPVTGTFRGAATSHMSTDILIEIIK
jgi:transglutaminase-like putative cysteine protease